MTTMAAAMAIAGQRRGGVICDGKSIAISIATRCILIRMEGRDNVIYALLIIALAIAALAACVYVIIVGSQA
jgi:hypothetical protein